MGVENQSLSNGDVPVLTDCPIGNNPGHCNLGWSRNVDFTRAVQCLLTNELCGLGTL